MNPPLIMALLLLGSAVLLLSLHFRQRLVQRQVLQRLGGSARARYELENSSLLSRALTLDSEVRQLLDRLGWRRARQRSLFTAIQLGLPLGLALLALLAQLLMEEPMSPVWVLPLAAAGIGYILPKRLLVRAVAQRQNALALEVSNVLPLLRILFEVGMTVEQSLRTLATDGRQILPELAKELDYVLARVDGGLELGAELHRAALLVDVDEVTDTFAILEQLIHQGGGAMASLLSLKELIDDRRMTALQELVSKMSAKMSVVMISFLFPALLMVLAGPGFIAIFNALGEMG
ncbi:type II secretion system F family protein [Pseudomonas sp. NW5]|uniref:type II secretion system F family protein n=1 Tax=Pseudomonas sp. NW5 TaxID=2934934 RepID=UPI0020220A01|nr:type II secretion system F family protein [Pseudomonas sp. NW5]MCL7462318.1 type II secretion system F family protein [Pseudomonas sp. NW5]